MLLDKPGVWIQTITLSFVLVIAGCSSVRERPAATNMKEIKHPNGLVVGVPEKFVAKQTETGYTIEPEGSANSRMRRAVEVRVSLVEKQNAPPGALLTTKKVNDREILYKVEKSDGGSGGEQYFFAAYESVPGGYIQFSQAGQSEYGEPEFELCWDVITATRYEPSVPLR